MNLLDRSSINHLMVVASIEVFGPFIDAFFRYIPFR